MSTPSPAGTVPRSIQLRQQECAENFPVALRLLPAALRTDLRAVYDVVRTIDELGDSAPGDRIAQLDAFARELAEVWTTGEPQAPVLRALVPTVARHDLRQQPFGSLITANLQDQQMKCYQDFDDLLQYCALSAAPIGRIVLQIFGAGTAAQRELSDRVCTALQLLEHWQDVAEDRQAGRIYLPQDDLKRFGVRTTDLDADHAAPALRQLILFETDRAADMLESGAVLVGTLSGWGRLAVAGYVAGGRAAVDSLRRVRGDVLAEPPRVRRRDVVRHLLTGWRDHR